MEFHLGHKREASNPDPVYNKPYGSQFPPIQAKGSLTYLQFIQVVKNLWEEGNPEVAFVPMGGKQNWDPDKGYIIYSQDRAVVKGDQLKPRLRHIVDGATGKKIMVFTQSFNHIVRFTAVHRDPAIAEQILESFEDFMIRPVTIIAKMLGLEELIYDRRPPSDMEKRYGDDVADRAVCYLVTVQKVLSIETDKLQEAYIQASIAIGMGDATPNGDFILASVQEENS